MCETRLPLNKYDTHKKEIFTTPLPEMSHLVVFRLEPLTPLAPQKSSKVSTTNGTTLHLTIYAIVCMFSTQKILSKSTTFDSANG